jgi:hypothetical protein
MGKLSDPFFGILSRGRRGAKARAALMAAAYAKTGRRNRDVGGRTSNPFKYRSRRAEFDATLKIGWSRNRAAKFARRVPAKADRSRGDGRLVPVHASGCGQAVTTSIPA